MSKATPRSNKSLKIIRAEAQTSKDVRHDIKLRLTFNNTMTCKGSPSYWVHQSMKFEPSKGSQHDFPSNWPRKWTWPWPLAFQGHTRSDPRWLCTMTYLTAQPSQIATHMPLLCLSRPHASIEMHNLWLSKEKTLINSTDLEHSPKYCRDKSTVYVWVDVQNVTKISAIVQKYCYLTTRLPTCPYIYVVNWPRSDMKSALTDH